MKWTPGTKNDDVVDVRGAGASASGGGGFRGPGMKLGGGGLVTLIIVVVVAKAAGVDISSLLGGSSNSGPAVSNTSAPQPPTGPDPDAALVDYIKFVMKDIQDTFEAKFKAEGREYRRAKLYIFSEKIDTACGRSSSSIGPFYCPGDWQAYIDLTFYRALEQRFGAPGKFAQAYVLAHEIGHHLQNMMGIDGKGNAGSVRQELQADCFAGVWGHEAQTRQLLEAGDIEQAITAAGAIGDDRLQKQAGVPVDKETWTHGSSDQRIKWFRIGFQTGSFKACDTFAVDQP